MIKSQQATNLLCLGRNKDPLIGTAASIAVTKSVGLVVTGEHLAL